jgi:sugar/nucleoside kinase (ribokinase family)
VVAGAASRDVTADDPRGWRLGGAAAYCSLTAARLGLRVGCLLGVDSLAATAHELSALEAAGVSLRLVELGHGPVFENLEAGGHRRQRWLSRSDAVPAAALPAEWRAAAGWLLVPVAGELGSDWEVAASTAALGGARVGVGWQGLLRRLDHDGSVEKVEPGPSPLLDAAGLVVASLDDVGRNDTIEELWRLAPRATMVLTAGEGGGIAMRDGVLRRYRAVSAENPVDPTGAGDVFLAALLTAWLMTGDVATAAALRFAAAAASCAVEGVGMGGVPSRAEVASRLGAG